MFVDVAIQSYKKPESLIYTCLSLKEFCGKHIDTIFIDDDLSGDKTMEFYQNPQFVGLMMPVKLKIRENNKRAGLYFFEKMMMKKRPKNFIWYIYYLMKKRRPAIVEENDIRYQWAINSTDKKYLYITHDDVEFRGDVIEKYLDAIQNGYIVVGDLGQCWRCDLTSKCNPEKINNGYKPTKKWPLTSTFNLKKRRACRINEWSCMIDVEATKKISQNSYVYYGIYEDLGDIAAYWFDYIVEHGYKFFDPLLDNKNLFYKHGWQGFPGYNTDIYGRENKYDSEMIKGRILERYGLKL